MAAFSSSPWPLLQLSDVCKDKEPCDPSKGPDDTFDYVDIASVSNETFEIVEPKKFVGRDAPSRARKRIRTEDVLVATTRPYLKSIAKVPAGLNEQVCSTGFCVLRAGGAVHSDWIFLAVLTDDFVQQLTAKMRGANYPAVTDRDVLDAYIPVPTIAEQIRIIARVKECLERVAEIERLRRASLVEREYLAESLVEVQLADVVGDDVCLADVCEITSRLIDPRDVQFQKHLHVGGANIEGKTGRLINLKTAADEKLKSGKFVFNASVVLYNKIRPYLMKVARPDFEGLCSADMYPLTPKNARVTRDFIYYVLMSRRFTEYAISGSNRAGMPKVNREHLFAYRFKLPSRAVQSQICEYLDSAVDAVHSLSHEMDAAELESAQLREAILRKAFAGDL